MRVRSKVALGVLGVSLLSAVSQNPDGGMQPQGDAGPFPFQVALVTRGFDENHPVGSIGCSGSWISPQWVLTAAHCLVAHPDGYTIFSNSETIDAANQPRVEATWFCKHSGFHADGNGVDVDDIGLIKVADPDRTRKTVLIPRSKDQESIPAQGAPALIGLRSDKDIPPYDTRVVNVISTLACQQVKKLSGVDNKMLCSGDPSPCLDNSGGPLAHQINDSLVVDDNLFLVGIISGGGSCVGDPNMPTVYTRVSQFATWIDPIIHAKNNGNAQEDASCWDPRTWPQSLSPLSTSASSLARASAAHAGSLSH